MDNLISISEAASILKEAGQEKSARRIQELCQAGKVNAKKVGQQWKLDPESLLKYIKGNSNEIINPIPKIEVRKTAKNRYIFTSAQDHTPVHEGWWKNLNVFANHIGAQIMVAPYTYKRKSEYSMDWFDENVQYSLVNNEIRLPGLRFCAQLNLSPTAVRPLSDLGTFTQGDWGVIPHPRVALNSIPTIGKSVTKMVMTTGTSTLPNYEHKKAGLKAEFHHIIGATLVEIDRDGTPFCRQLIADENGTFQDLDVLVKNGKIYEKQRVEAITWGDIHLAKPDDSIIGVCWGFEGCVIDTLKPKYQFFHDLLDFNARNHHRILDPHHWYEMAVRGKDSVEHELVECVGFLRHAKRPWCKSVVVESNHDLALLKWLKTVDPKFDPVNAIFYHEAQIAIYKAILANDRKFNIFRWALERADGDKLNGVDFVDQNGGYSICNGEIECGTHGHLGANGSRGSTAGFSRMACKMNIGHQHSAQIMDGVYVAGMSGNLDQGYNPGPSSWSASHIVTYPTGKRTIITHRNGKWRA